MSAANPKELLQLRDELKVAGDSITDLSKKNSELATANVELTAQLAQAQTAVPAETAAALKKALADCHSAQVALATSEATVAGQKQQINFMERIVLKSDRPAVASATPERASSGTG